MRQSFGHCTLRFSRPLSRRAKYNAANAFMSQRLFRDAAKKAQRLAEIEQDPDLKAAHLQRAQEMNEWAEVTALQRKLEKAISARKKDMTRP